MENVTNCTLISHFATGAFPQVFCLGPHHLNTLHCKIMGTPMSISV